MHTGPLFATLAALGLTACADPLLGRWQTDAPPPDAPPPVGVVDYHEVVAFRGDHTMTDATTLVWDSRGGAVAGCTEVFATSGLTWSDAGGGSGGTMTLTVSGAGTTTETRSGCADATMDVADAPASAASTGALERSYRLDGGFLTLESSAGSVTFTPVSS